jgi:fructuronate reductase
LNNLEAIPLVIGGWLRYLLGVDDSGNPFEISPDPLLPSLLPVLSGITLGSDFDPGVADPILSNEAIFGLDLLGTPIANKAKEYFKKLSAAPGAVRKTLDEFAGS